MPVMMTPSHSGTDRSQCCTGCARPSVACVERKSKNLSIGLLNNMPDGALESTERQFMSLLNAASDELSISLSCYRFPEIPRGASTQNHIDRYYKSVESLWTTELDGLIVTGKEPNASHLSGEPFWPSFVSVVEWARENTCSTVWSCLAAHAAVLHMDGIERVRSNQKHSGILDCVRTTDHTITANLPTRFRVPHSRWNGLQESDLTGSGYQVLTRTGGAGVDCFVKQEQSLFLFFQGHPEYQLDTLLLEYRRDVARYLRGETAVYPNVPQGYFDHKTLHELSEVQRGAADRPYEETFARLEVLLSTAGVEDGWHATAITLYRNWLRYIAAEKKTRMQKKNAQAAIPPDVLPQQVLQPALLDPAVLMAR
jgi:homoserine O-succinyltransferase/O-acetyltransferase